MQRKRSGLGVAIYGTLALFLAFQSGVARADTLVSYTTSGIFNLTSGAGFISFAGTSDSVTVNDPGTFETGDLGIFTLTQPGSGDVDVTGTFTLTIQQFDPANGSGGSTAQVIGNVSSSGGGAAIISFAPSAVVIPGPLGFATSYLLESVNVGPGDPGIFQAIISSTAPANVPLPAAAWGGLGLFGLLSGGKLRRKLTTKA
jgi:hypothetical protein